jgi:hypothetical protein
MTPMGAVISAGDEKTIAGSFGRLAQEYHEFYSEFNRTFVWVMDGTLTGKRVDHGSDGTTFTGVLRDLQANYSDVMLVPMPRSPDPDIVEFGHPVDSYPVLMLSPLDVRQYPDQILTQLFRLSLDIMFLLILTMIVFAWVLIRCERKHETVSSVSDRIMIT